MDQSRCYCNIRRVVKAEGNAGDSVNDDLEWEDGSVVGMAVYHGSVFVLLLVVHSLVVHSPV
jgi:hypothetical protein